MRTLPTAGTRAVVLTRNRREDTLACLDSIVATGFDSCSIIVVDNASQDGTVKAVAQAYPQVQILSNDRNLGFAAGMNAGIRQALRQGAEYVLILNNDTVVRPGCVEYLLAAAAQPDAGVAVPKICFASAPDTIWSAGARWAPFPLRVKMIGYGALDGQTFASPRIVEQATACCLLVRRKVFEIAGLFDERFFMYFEDYDFCYRVVKAGFRLLYTPEAVVWHKVSMGLGENSPDKWFWLGYSSARFYLHSLGKGRLTYGLFVAWVIARETAKSNLLAVRPFLRGVSLGLSAIGSKSGFGGSTDVTRHAIT